MLYACVVSLILFISVSTLDAQTQTQAVSDGLPDEPQPAIELATTAPKAVRDNMSADVWREHMLRPINRIAAGSGKWLESSKMTYNLSRAFLTSATALDMRETAHWMPHDQYVLVIWETKPGYTANASQQKFWVGPCFEERGWARIFGGRNVPAVVTSNVLLSELTLKYADRLYRKGGRYRLFAEGLNLFKASSNLYGYFSWRKDRQIEKEWDNPFPQVPRPYKAMWVAK